MTSPLLSVTKLFKYFSSRGQRELRGTPEQLRRDGPVRAVDGVTFEVHAHETFGLVGRAAAASPPWAGASCGCSSPPPGRWRSGART